MLNSGQGAPNSLAPAHGSANDDPSGLGDMRLGRGDPPRRPNRAIPGAASAPRRFPSTR